tara:strand:- start:537 stop:1439 length:903 start_codon:yes stop_codon:yes gene_type:complete
MGETLSLLSAFFWACAVIIFKNIGDKVSPIMINAIKNTIGVFLIFITIYLLDMNSINIPTKIDFNDIMILLISGTIGLGIADILFLKSLNILGASLTALIDIVYSPFVLFFAFILLGEKLLIIQIFGGFLILFSIIFASYKHQNINLSRLNFLKGVLIGISALAMMAVCIVLIKPILNKTETISSQLWVAGFRMIPGSITPIILSLIYIKPKKIIKILKNIEILKPICLGAFFATYLGISFWIIGMANTKASIAAILNQTASFFILILARIFLKEIITMRKLIAIIIASFGSILIIIGNK